MLSAINLLIKISSLSLFVYLGATIAAFIVKKCLGLKDHTNTGVLNTCAQNDPPKPDSFKENIRVFLTIVLMFIFSRAVIFGAPYLRHLYIEKTAAQGFWIFSQSIWRVWDACHYLSLAQGGYSADPQNGFLIVFFPLYPLLIRAFYYLTNHYLSAAMLISNISLLAGCFFLYQLACLDYDKKTALRCVKYVLVYPASFFFSMAYTESVFLALFIITVYLIRLKKWSLCGLFAFLAILTRGSHGNFLVIIFLIEFLTARPVAPLEIKKIPDKKPAFFPLLFFGFCAICANAIYLLLNKVLLGNYFAFAQYQSQKWFHRFLFFPDNLVDMLHTSFGYSPWQNLTLWWPGILSFFLAGLLFALTIKKLRLSYSIYFFIYLFSIYSIYWSISVTRYIMASFPIFIMLALSTGKKRIDISLTAFSFILLIIYATTFARGNLFM